MPENKSILDKNYFAQFIYHIYKYNFASESGDIADPIAWSETYIKGLSFVSYENWERKAVSFIDS